MDAQSCADFIVKKSLDLNKEITNLQLQKILFLIASIYHEENGEMPFSQQFEGWDYGPVQVDVYHDYNGYGSSPITRVCQHEEFDFDKCELVPHLKNDVDDSFKKQVEIYLPRLLNANVFDIVDYTHSQDFWKDNEQLIQKRKRPVYPNDKVILQASELNKLLNKWGV